MLFESLLLNFPYLSHHMYRNMSPLRRGGGHTCIVFGVDPVGVGICVGVAFCLHDIS